MTKTNTTLAAAASGIQVDTSYWWYDQYTGTAEELIVAGITEAECQRRRTNMFESDRMTEKEQSERQRREAFAEEAAARVDAPAKTNVLPFVRPAHEKAPKAPRSGRERIVGNVLKFTGKKRYNYDR